MVGIGRAEDSPVEMESETAHLPHLQPHVLEYVTGVLWLLALLIAWPGSSNVAGLTSAVATVLKPLTQLKLPDFVVGFLVSVGGVVVPYALALAFRPITIWLMNALLKLMRIVQKRVLNLERRDLHRVTVAKLQEALGISSDIDSPEQLAYIASHDQSAATNLEWSYNDVVFRAGSTLPSALMFAAIAYRFTVASFFTSTVVGVVVFGISAAYSIEMLGRWRDRAESLIALYSKRDTSANDPAPRV